MDRYTIVWSKTAKVQLKSIFEYYRDIEQTPIGAQNVKDNILRATREIVFPEQYQKDEIQPEYR